MKAACALFAIGAALAPAVATGQMALSTISGVVVGPSGAPPPATRVDLLDPLGHVVRTAAAEPTGRFRFGAVPPGTYDLRAEGSGLRSPLRRVVPADGLPIEVVLPLAAARAEDVSVVAPDAAPGPGTTMAGDAVARAPSPLRTGAVRLAVASAPGWTSEDNGLVHFRGSDDGILFVLDGVPVYERLDPQFGIGVDPASIGSMRVLSGHVPAEFGLRSGGVVEVRSRLEETRGWSGSLDASAGGQGSRGAAALAQGPLGGGASLSLTASGERSQRFLDPPRLDGVHNAGSTGLLAADALWLRGRGVVSVRAAHGGSSFEVPTPPEGANDQHQRLAQTAVTANWQHSWTARTVSQVALFTRLTDARLEGAASDRPLFVDARREQDRTGLLAAVTREHGRHRLKAGFELSALRLDERFHFVVTDVEEGAEAGLSEAALSHGPDDPFDFEGGTSRAIASVYVQDSWQPIPRLSLDAGLRYDRSHLLLRESAVSPRLAAAYDAGRATVRISLDRFFQPPQPEFLLVSSSPEARALSPFVEDLGTGGTDVPAERQWSVEAGVDLRAGPLRADLALWRRWIRNQGDPNVFLGSTVIFPNSVAQGRALGLDLRLELRRRRGLSGFVTYTLAKVEQVGPIDGGLFLEDDVIEIGPGTVFTPDHDQRHALTAEVAWENARTGTWISVGGRLRSGTPLEVDEDEKDELAEREGADLVDFAAGRTRPYTVVDVQAGQRLVRRGKVEIAARAALLNAFGARYAFNFGNPFSGTHFGAPRTLRLAVAVALR